MMEISEHFRKKNSHILHNFFQSMGEYTLTLFMIQNQIETLKERKITEHSSIAIGSNTVTISKDNINITNLELY